MRILITGPTSFSGAYFIEALSKSGHDVVTTFTQSLDSYTGVRRLRAEKAARFATIHEGVSFGDEAFLELVTRESFDVFCHHGAWTKDYNSIEYDFESAFSTNTRSLNVVCKSLADRGCRKIIVSGSIFEEGDELFSPHGLVKKMTAQTMEFYGNHFGMHVSKFVIPNPFGALDNPKLIDYLGREWYAGRVPCIRTPLYVRDNLPVDLMARGFSHWVQECPDTVGKSSYSPSGYISTMGEFVSKVASEMRERLGLKCAFELGVQTDFSQPMVLVNNAPLQHLFEDWDESAFWDDLAVHQKNLQS
jgi:nucleoside-diphosphate-sugar epimerase